MTIEMGILHRESGEYEIVPVATNKTFREVWLPACERLGMSLVPLFYGGALVHIPPNLLPRIVSELKQLRKWAASQQDDDYLVDRREDILAAVARTDPDECDYDIG
jgi:hypothetical protein